MSARLLRSSVMLLVVTLLLAACAPSSAPSTGPGEKAAPSDQAQGAQGTETPKHGGILVKSAGASSYSGMDPAMGQMSYDADPSKAKDAFVAGQIDFSALSGLLQEQSWSSAG